MLEVSGQLPEASGELPEVRGELPEASGELPGGSGALPEPSGRLPETMGGSPEAIGCLPVMRRTFVYPCTAAAARLATFPHEGAASNAVSRLPTSARFR